MIIATAGHVDHGKTSLIRQLTGVDTDRLEEEKRRGLSINLGYAYLPRASGTPLGFIDVPGHQRFINNMIAGISGIDLGMLVVAADDGPMPQTLEHLDVSRTTLQFVSSLRAWSIWDFWQVKLMLSSKSGSIVNFSCTELPITWDWTRMTTGS